MSRRGVETTSSPLDVAGILEIQKMIWSKINETEKPITLWTHNDRKELRRRVVIPPGGQIVLPKQVQFLQAMEKYDAVLYGGSVGSGKLAYRGQDILTPFGFKKIEDFQVGDAINNPDGSVAEVIQLHPWGEHEVWRVHFHDGTFTDVTDGHLWQAWRAGRGKKKKSTSVFGEPSAQVVETRRLKEWCDKAKNQKSRGKVGNFPCIPICKEQAFNQTSKNPGLIDPYVLGSLLGDGHCGQTVTLTTADHEHFAAQFKGYTYSRHDKAGNRAASYSFIGESGVKIQHALDILGLRDSRSGNKFIPNVYKHGSIETRYAMLQGLMDTDGTVDKNGKPSFCSTSKQLADDVAFIIRSLGGVVTITVKKMDHVKASYLDAYILYIKHPDPKKLFRLKRKRDRARNTDQTTLFRKVVDVEILDERRWGRCLTVSHPNGLYIVNDFIVTHNSFILRWALIWLLLKWALPKEQGGYGLRKVKVGLFCETYTALEDRQISALKAMPETLGTWNDKMKEFRLHERLGGGIIKCRNTDEYWKYASVEFAAIAIDELTFLTKPTFDFLRSRRRYPPIEHCPIICATNPGNIGHQWVYEEFVDANTRVKPYYDEELDYRSQGYYFIQAFPQDNPFLTKQYLADMARWPEKQRKALVEGDWTVYAGQYFTMLDPNIHLIAPFDIPQTWSRFRAIDYGSAHPTVCLWGATDEKGNLYIYREYSMGEEYATYNKRRIVEMSVDKNGEPESYRLTVGDPNMWWNERSTESNKMPAEVYNDPNDGLGSLNMMKANNARIQGWQALADGFSYELEGGRYDFDDKGRPDIKFLRRPRIYIFNNCIYTWRSLTNVIHDDVKVEDVKKPKGVYGPGKGDDEAECLRYLNLAASSTVANVPHYEPKGIKAPWSRFTKNKFKRDAAKSYARF